MSVAGQNAHAVRNSALKRYVVWASPNVTLTR
jgi:hypothetical protein